MHDIHKNIKFTHKYMHLTWININFIIRINNKKKELIK